VIPSGNTAARPVTPTGGYLRFNSENSSFEGYNGSAWAGIGGGGAVVSVFDTRTAAIAATIDASVNRVLLGGLATVGDKGGGFYIRLGSAPSPARSWHFASNGGTVWWRLDVDRAVSCRQLGAVGDGTADDTTALQDTLDYAGSFDTRAYVPSGAYAVPTGTLSVPSGVIMEGDGDTSVIRRTTNAVVPLVRCLSAVNPAVRDIRLDSLAGWPSTSSHSVTTGSKVFTVTAGIDVAVSDGVQITSTASPQNYMIGTVTAYSGTSLTVNVTSAIGSGTLAAWRFDKFNGENTALSAESSTNADFSGVVITGRFYVGVRSLNGSGDSISECEISGTVNRPIYLYATSGTADGCRITNNRVRGGGFAQYGINLNGSGGVIDNAVIHGNIVDQTVFQGIEAGGSTNACTISSNQVDGVSSGNGIGILVQRANSVQPTDVIVTGNTVKNVTGTGRGIYVIDAFYCNVTSNTVTSCGTGIQIAQVTAGIGCQYHTVSLNSVRNCSVDGIRFSAANVGLCSGHTCSANRTVANTTFGIVSDSNTDRIAFVGNFSLANGTQLATTGTNHSAAGNIAA
jgi:Pectate lyase superfamily protein/Right handed beta helix region